MTQPAHRVVQIAVIDWANGLNGRAPVGDDISRLIASMTQCVLTDRIHGAPRAINDIVAERQRQISKEGWTPEHDDRHSDGSLAMAAALYAAPTELYQVFASPSGVQWRDPWPWKRDANHGRYEGIVEVNDGDKRQVHDRRRRLVIAAALTVAEIERLDRKTSATPSVTLTGKDGSAAS